MMVEMLRLISFEREEIQLEKSFLMSPKEEATYERIKVEASVATLTLGKAKLQSELHYTQTELEHIVNQQVSNREDLKKQVALTMKHLVEIAKLRNSKKEAEAMHKNVESRTRSQKNRRLGLRRACKRK